MSENLRKFYEDHYAQLRLDGKTHEEAMTILDDAVKAAIPVAVSNFLDDVLGPSPSDSGATERKKDD